MKLMSLSEEKQHLYWLSLSVDEDVIKYLSGPNFIMYDKYSRQITLEKGKGRWGECVWRFPYILKYFVAQLSKRFLLRMGHVV